MQRWVSPLRPSVSPAQPPFVRWMVMLWLAASILGLLFVAGSLVWIAWFDRPVSPPTFALPLVWIPVLDIPVLVAIAGYGAAIFACWRRRPALQPWLIGAAGHLVFLFGSAIVSGGVDPATMFSFDALFGWIRLLIPGMVILTLDRSRIENPLQP